MLLTALALIVGLSGQQTSPAGSSDARETAVPAEVPVQVAPVPVDATPPEEPVRQRQICRNIQVTGTRFPVRSCRNAVQTDAERREAAEMLRRMQGARTPPAG